MKLRIRQNRLPGTPFYVVRLTVEPDGSLEITVNPTASLNTFANEPNTWVVPADRIDDGLKKVAALVKGRP